ncbi:MAG: hypothetical protein SNI81_06565, partial [Rikenellaceae bacterium]
RWAVRFDTQQTINELSQEEEVNYLEEIFDYKPTLDEIKAVVASGIDLYDASDEVSSFSISGVSMWLDKSARTGLSLTITTLLNNLETSIRSNSGNMTEEEIVSSFNAEAAETNIRLWSLDTPPSPFDLTIINMQTMLGALETYAKATFDQTQLHKSNMYALTTTEEVLNYNYRTGYPDKLAL